MPPALTFVANPLEPRQHSFKYPAEPPTRRKPETARCAGRKDAASNRRCSTTDIYRPLNGSARQIRLAELAPGRLGDPVQCTIVTVSLNDEPAYEALSWARGDTGITQSVSLGGGVYVNVPTALHSVLQHLRLTDRPRRLWVDELCIRREDTQEHNSQVALMGKIYGDADRVIAWLGDGDEDSELALDALGAIACCPSAGGEMPCPVDVFFGPTYVEATLEFLRRPWWHRVWTLQELLLADEVEIACGRRRMAWGAFLKSATNWMLHSSTCCHDTVMTNDTPVMEDILRCLGNLVELESDRRQVDDLDFLDVLAKTRERDCEDPRDRIFGVMALARENLRNFVQPNYDKPVAEVYAEATLGFMRQTRSLDIWSSMQPLSQPAELRGEPAPSWVVDWGIHGPSSELTCLERRRRSISSYDACGGRSLVMESRGPGKIAVEGVVVGNVDALGDIKLPDELAGPEFEPDVEEAAELYEEWRDLLGEHFRPGDAYPRFDKDPGDDSDGADEDPESRFAYDDAFHLTLCADMLSRGEPRGSSSSGSSPREERLLHAAWWKWLASPDAEFATYGVLAGKLALYNSQVATATARRRFFVSNEELGLMGLAPEQAREGDAIAVFGGGKVPFLLRPAGWDKGGERIWKLVGDCYVHGLMNGEGFKVADVGTILLS